MILYSLYELYDRLSKDKNYEIAPPGYSLQKIAFRIVINTDGSLHAIQSLNDKDTKRPVQMIVPGGDKPAGGVTAKSVHKKVQFLRNDLSFLIGVAVKESGKLVVTEREFEAFKKFHLNMQDIISDEEYQLVCRFLGNWRPEKAKDMPMVEWDQFANGQGVFQIKGHTHYVHERPAVMSWWNSRQNTTQTSTDFVAQCLITGEKRPIARLHEPKIKKVMGSQTAGAPIVSFDKDSDAFASYGQDGKQAFNAPVSKDAAFRYATALNALLDGPMSYKHRFTLGDATIVFWTKEPTNTEDIFAQFVSGGFRAPITESQDESVRQKIELFLKALRKGHEAYAELDDKADQTSFYLLGLTGQAKGRIGVRFFYRDMLSMLLDNLRRHYADMAVVRRFDENAQYPDPEFPALWQILDETCPRRNGKADRKQIPPILEGPLLRAVVTGNQYPAGLFTAVMRRIHADREVNYVRACVIAGFLRRNMKQEVSMSLDNERKDPAYRLGRIFAVLERIQELAHWQQTGHNLEKGIRDNFFSAACSTPATVFPRIERLSTHHRRQLAGSQKHYFDQLIADIKDGQSDPPSVLSLKEQSAFLLGYYHQWKKLREKKENETKE